VKAITVQPTRRPPPHCWAFVAGRPQLDRCSRTGCTAERLADTSSRFSYRASASARWQTKIVPCMGLRKGEQIPEEARSK
jgi:hypothetical protein